MSDEEYKNYLIDEVKHKYLGVIKGSHQWQQYAITKSKLFGCFNPEVEEYIKRNVDIYSGTTSSDYDWFDTRKFDDFF